MTVSTMMMLVVLAAEFSPFSRAKGFPPQPENCDLCSGDVTRLRPDKQELQPLAGLHVAYSLMMTTS
jgi:hypothetical protein